MLNFSKDVVDKTSDWIVFVHGFGGNRHVWSKQVLFFRNYFNLLLIDLPGHGGSVSVSETESYAYSQIVTEIIAVLDHLKIQRAHFMGVSIGCMLNNIIASRFSERTRSIIQVGAITHLNFFAYFASELVNSFSPIIPYMWFYKLGAWILMPRANHKQSRDFFIRAAVKVGQEEAVRWFTAFRLETIASFKELEASHSTVPMLFISGTQDHMWIRNVRKDVASLKNGKFVAIENAGHICNIDQSEEFNRIALDFFSQHAEHMHRQ